MMWCCCSETALARVPAPVRGAQCATQAGIEGLAICLRQELRPRGVDVAVVAAGEFAAGTAWLSESSMLEQVRYAVLVHVLVLFVQLIIQHFSIFYLEMISCLSNIDFYSGPYNVGTIECRTKA